MGLPEPKVSDQDPVKHSRMGIVASANQKTTATGLMSSPLMTAGAATTAPTRPRAFSSTGENRFVVATATSPVPNNLLAAASYPSTPATGIVVPRKRRSQTTIATATSTLASAELESLLPLVPLSGSTAVNTTTTPIVTRSFSGLATGRFSDSRPSFFPLPYSSSTVTARQRSVSTPVVSSSSSSRHTAPFGLTDIQEIPSKPAAHRHYSQHHLQQKQHKPHVLYPTASFWRARQRRLHSLDGPETTATGSCALYNLKSTNSVPVILKQKALSASISRHRSFSRRSQQFLGNNYNNNHSLHLYQLSQLFSSTIPTDSESPSNLPSVMAAVSAATADSSSQFRRRHSVLESNGISGGGGGPGAASPRNLYYPPTSSRTSNISAVSSRGRSTSSVSSLTGGVGIGLAMASSNAYSPEPARSSIEFSRRFDISRSGSISGSMTSSLPSEEDDLMPPTPGREPLNRAGRSASSASRTNRLSLTLPIALPTSMPSRPTPSTATTNSLPATPQVLNTAQSPYPSDTNEFIIAIAAQERRVLEIKEDLARAETDLAGLKKHWMDHEAYKRHDFSRTFSPTTPMMDDDNVSARLSQELDRRKLLRNLQKSPREGRRKVFRGGHARTLSLLSPTKPEPDYSLLDGPIEDLRTSSAALSRSRSLRHTQNAHSTNSISSNSSNGGSHSRRDAHAPTSGPGNSLSDSQQFSQPSRSSGTSAGSSGSVAPTAAQLSKRATWQPRAAYPPTSVGVSQLVEELKLGFRSFYDDIKQITVGDEPVTGRRANGSYVYSSFGGGNNGGPMVVPAPSISATRSAGAVSAQSQFGNSSTGAGKSYTGDSHNGRISGRGEDRTSGRGSSGTSGGLAASPVPHDATLNSSRASSTGATQGQTSRSNLSISTDLIDSSEDHLQASTTSAAASPVSSAAMRRRSRDCSATGRGGPLARIDGNGAPGLSKPKHFSWTPLSFDALDDADWSNWEVAGAGTMPGSQRGWRGPEE